MLMTFVSGGEKEEKVSVKRTSIAEIYEPVASKKTPKEKGARKRRLA